MFLEYRKPIIIFFILLSLASAACIPFLRFSFDFEQFFPQGDSDLEFFKEFISEFETDDNFLLIAVENKPTIFDSTFLTDFHKYSLDLRNLPYIKNVECLTQMRYPVKTPFGYNSIPIIHRNNPDKYDQDKRLILSDSRFVNNLINEKADAMVAALKIKDLIGLEESRELMGKVDSLNKRYNFQSLHMLGRPDLQTELVKMQMIEVFKTSVLSMILVTIILFLLYRRLIGVMISLVSIGMGLTIFAGVMFVMGRALDALAALYPILLLIVGTSDVIHIQSKYIDELRKGKEKRLAMITTIKEIGLATLLTSTTTAIGFATLVTSKVRPIQEFGLNAAVAVMVAYLTVVLFTTSWMTYFPKEKISKYVDRYSIWDGILLKAYKMTIKRPLEIGLVSIILLGVFLWGISMITTNYRIEQNLPKGARVTNDFIYFEKEFAGFRPLEFAIDTKGDYNAEDFEVVREVNKLDDKLLQMDQIKSVVSLATLYKSIERMNSGNTQSAYIFPEKEADFRKAKRLLDRSKMADEAVLISKDGKKTRISTKIADLGADSIKAIGRDLDNWVNTHVDSSVISVKRTGTGIILDKNSDYIRDSLLSGLAIAILAVSILMGIIFGSWKMLLIAIVPNLFPLLLAGGIIGFFGIELEAGVSVVFAIIFGIAVDDTIHFLSKFKLARQSGKTMEEAMQVTFTETGKAIVFTTIILFFGFMLMLFSSHQPSVTIGVLISTTLVGAVVCDLTILPVLIRKFL